MWFFGGLWVIFFLVLGSCFFIGGWEFVLSMVVFWFLKFKIKYFLKLDNCIFYIFIDYREYVFVVIFCGILRLEIGWD